MPSLPHIAFELGAAVAAIWIGGAVLFDGVDRVRAYLRHHRPAMRRREHTSFRPGPAQDL